MKGIVRLVFAMVNQTSSGQGPTVSGVCWASDDCDQCPFQNGCWFIEPMVVS